MKLRDFKIGWRMLVQEPAYSAVVILGLSVGFAACFLLLAFVRYSLSYDAQVPDADRIYLIKSKVNIIGKPAWSETTPFRYEEAALRSGLVEASTMIKTLPSALKVGTRVHKIEVVAAMQSFPQMFGISAIEGDVQAALARPDKLALTASTARSLFGHTRVLGAIVQIAGKPYTVAALLADPPSNSSIRYAALTSVLSSAWNEEQNRTPQQAWGDSFGASIFVKLKPGASASALNQHLQSTADHSPMAQLLPPAVKQKLGTAKAMEIRLGALRDMLFDPDTANSPLGYPHSDRRSVIGLAAVALLILLLAVSNYVNLATVHTLRRQREIAIRKVLGASAARLTGKFVAEALLVSVLATGLGLMLAWLLLPLFAELMNRQLDHVFTAGSLLFALALALLVGVAAAAYPAWVALRVRPAQALSGRGNSETAGALRLRRVLTVLQFSSAMGLISVTLAISWQTHFASQASPGFDPKPLLQVEMPDALDGAAATRSLRAALERLPGVTGVAAAQDAIGAGIHCEHVDMYRLNGKRASVCLRRVSANFFEVYGVRPLAGRLLSSQLDAEDPPKDWVAVINSSAARALGFANPQEAVGQTISSDVGDITYTSRIVGVEPDIRHESLRDASQPMFYAPSRWTSVLTVRTSGNMAALEQATGALQRQYFPDDVLGTWRAQEVYAANYLDDVRLAKLLALASLIAVALAAFGIYVLSAYSVQRLTRQIVLRKLYGAGRRAIASLVGREFIARSCHQRGDLPAAGHAGNSSLPCTVCGTCAGRHLDPVGGLAWR